jgi:UDP-N-acetylglucosamine 2-epimerase (non-hydrolysing)
VDANPRIHRFLEKAGKGRAVVCFVFGTRPEAIKLAPLIKAVQDHPDLVSRVVITSQHREMLDQVLRLFEIEVHADLEVMETNQSLFHVASTSLGRMETVLAELSPDLVIVQGDTLTTFCAALGAFFQKIPLGHIEAGLRTRDKFSPFPEEMSRVLVTRLADWHFAPTERASENLRSEGIDPKVIFVTGNTVIDAAREVAGRTDTFSLEGLRGIPFRTRRVLLVTAHRRESFGEPYREICKAIRDTLREFPDVHVLFPYHLNPNACGPALEILGDEPAATLVPPLPYSDSVLALRQAWAVVTDSGGIQEEAPSFGKPVLVMRKTTERPEGISAGIARLVGTDYEGLRQALRELLGRPDVYERMAGRANPYGDGRAVERILEVLRTGTLEQPFRAEPHAP